MTGDAPRPHAPTSNDPRARAASGDDPRARAASGDNDHDDVARQIAAWYAAPVATDPTHQHRLLASALAQPSPTRRFRYWIPATCAAAALFVAAALTRAHVKTLAPAPVAVRFVLRGAPTAAHVTLVGDFNGWNTTATPLGRTPSGTVWTVDVRVPPGRYDYAFVVDGHQWIPDPTAPLTPDAFGNPTSVLVVGPGGTT